MSAFRYNRSCSLTHWKMSFKHKIDSRRQVYLPASSWDFPITSTDVASVQRLINWKQTRSFWGNTCLHFNSVGYWYKYKLLDAIISLLITDKGSAGSILNQTFCNRTIYNGWGTIIMMMSCISTCTYSYTYCYEYISSFCVFTVIKTFMFMYNISLELIAYWVFGTTFTKALGLKLHFV